jgi:D-3-phosphoglycerate dehydrogenase
MQVAIGPSSFADQDKTPQKILEQSGIEVKPNPYGRRLAQNEIIEHLKGAVGLIAGLEPLNRKVLATAPQLKAIARVGIGMDNVDQATAAELGIKVSNTPDGPTEAVAELCLTALLSLKRKLVSFNKELHQGVWQKHIGMGLRDSNVLLVGYGRIGKRFGELLRFFKAKLWICDPNLKQSNLALDERLVTLSEGLKQCDVISLHASGTDKILGDAQFAKMKPGTILLNSARGTLVDENSLIHALKKEIISGAWLDVYNNEPYDGPLKNYEQVLLTPHVSTYTRQCRRSMEESAVRNLLRDLDIKLK